MSRTICVSIETAGRAYFGVAGLFDIFGMADSGRSLVVSDRYERMALDRALANLNRAQRDLTADVLSAGGFDAWRGQHEAAIARTVGAVSELMQGTATVSRLSVAAGLLADLAREG